MAKDSYREKAHVQLLSYSNEDEYLYSPTGPSYFRSMHKQHAPLAIDTYSQNMESAQFGKRVRMILASPLSNANMMNHVDKVGDVLGSLFLEVRLPKIVSNSILGWKNHIGHRLIRRLELHLDRMPIDTWDDRLLDIDFELYEKNQPGARALMYKYESDWSIEGLGKESELSVYVPIPFRWGKPGRSFIPWCAVTESELSLVVEFAPLVDLLEFDPDETLQVQIIPTGPGVSVVFGTPKESWVAYEEKPTYAGELRANLWIESFHIQEEERQMIRNVTHDLLLETHQVFEFQVEAGRKRFTIDFRDEGIRTPFPVKEWIIILQENDEADRFTYTVPVRLKRVWLTLDDHTHLLLRNTGIDQEGRFRWTNMYSRYHSISLKPIYTFTFSLYPTSHQPSGHMDFSKFKKKFLLMEFVDSIPEAYNVTIYETRYHLFHIENGFFTSHRM